MRGNRIWSWWIKVEERRCRAGEGKGKIDGKKNCQNDDWIKQNNLYSGYLNTMFHSGTFKFKCPCRKISKYLQNKKFQWSEIISFGRIRTNKYSDSISSHKWLMQCLLGWIEGISDALSCRCTNLNVSLNIKISSISHSEEREYTYHRASEVAQRLRKSLILNSRGEAIFLLAHLRT